MHFVYKIREKKMNAYIYKKLYKVLTMYFKKTKIDRLRITY